MATYPATNTVEASELLVSVSNQMHEIVNEDAVTEVTTESGPVPSVRKALADTFLFIEPVAWNSGNNETAFNQLRTFGDETYWAPTATLTNPVAMGATPVGDNNWKIAPTGKNNSIIQGWDTAAQEELLPQGSKIYPRIGYLANGMTVTTGTTHLRVLAGGEPTIVAMSPLASGVVSLLTETGATIGVDSVDFTSKSAETVFNKRFVQSTADFFQNGNGQTYSTGDRIQTNEFYAGTGIGGGTWEKTGVTGQTPSQLPADWYASTGLGGRGVDANGDEWKFINTEKSEINILQTGALGNRARSYINEVMSAVAYAEENRLTLDLDNINVATDGPVTMSASLSVTSGARAVFQSINGYKGVGVEIENGNGNRKIFGTIDGYGRGLKQRCNVGFTQFRTISRCSDGGLVIASEGHNVLDAVIRGTQIGLCDRAIIFESDSDENVMQGNDIEINFLSQNRESIVFEDNGTHTQQADWDSNEIRLQAIDPIGTGPTSKVIYNATPYAVPRLRLSVASWLGGLDAGAKLIQGPFIRPDFEFSLAQAMTPDRIDASSVASIASGRFRIKDGSNFGAGVSAYVDTIGTNNIADFNGGRPFHLGVNALKVIVPVVLAPGQSTQSPRCFHFLAKSNQVPFFSLTVLSGNAPVYIYAHPAGTESDGMIRITVVNLGTVNIPAGTEYLCSLKAGD